MNLKLSPSSQSTKSAASIEPGAVDEAPMSGSVQLRAYVINLAKNPKRWEEVARSAAAFEPGIALTRIDAVDGRDAAHAAREQADVATFERINGRDMLPGEYGCYLSHLKALRTFLDDGVPYGLILEDDVAFTEDSEARIRAIIGELPQFGVVKLVNHRAKLLIELCSTKKGDKVGRTIHGPQGSAAAYLVTREGAQKLLDKLSKMVLPWDVALERFWHHGAEAYSVRSNVLAFTEERKKSDISGGGYAKAKYPWYRRLGAARARTSDYVRRVSHVIQRPQRALVDAEDPVSWKQILAGFLVLVLVSAVWAESDAYRFAGAALILAALWRYYCTDIWNYRRFPEIGWMGHVCLLWGIYVLARFGVSLAVEPEKGIGSAEGIYLLPALYPTLGYAMSLFVRRPFILATAFMVISLLALSLGIDHTGADVRADALLQHNPIHASVAAGLICLCVVPYALHVLRRRDLARPLKFGLVVFSAIVFVFSGLAIYGLWSKGVWLAMIVALPVLLLTLMAAGGHHGKSLAMATAIVAVVGVILNYDTVARVAGGTIETTSLLISELLHGRPGLQALDVLINDPTTPMSEKERLILWYDALHLWGEYPVFGPGVSWLTLWWQQPYAAPYNLIHNGYLEIAVRYGWTGLAFYALLFGWSLVTVYRAAHARIIDVAAAQAYIATMVFFAVTLVSNSNNRLAIGESYMWFASGFAFYCHFLLANKARQEAAAAIAAREAKATA